MKGYYLQRTSVSVSYCILSTTITYWNGVGVIFWLKTEPTGAVIAYKLIKFASAWGDTHGNMRLIGSGFTMFVLLPTACESACVNVTYIILLHGLLW